jgi:hypothetical protein
MYDPEIAPAGFFILARRKDPSDMCRMGCKSTGGLELLLFTERRLAEEFRDASHVVPKSAVVREMTLGRVARGAAPLFREGKAVGLWIDPVVPEEGPHTGGVEGIYYDAEQAPFWLDRWERAARYAAPRN